MHTSHLNVLSRIIAALVVAALWAVNLPANVLAAVERPRWNNGLIASNCDRCTDCLQAPKDFGRKNV